MATLTGKQLKDSYQGLLTIKTADDANPLSGRLENGLGNAITALGIGTDSPDSQIELSKSSSSNYTALKISNTNTSGTGGRLTFENTLAPGSFESGHIRGATYSFGNGGLIFGYNNSGTATGDTEAMRIANSGDISFRDGSANEAFYWDASTARLGLGTTSPNRNLHVEGDMELSKASGNAGFRIVTDATSEGYLIFGDPDDNSMGGVIYDNATDALMFDVNNAERMTIDSSGNVGIGTTSPTEKLAVQSAFTTSASDVFLEINSGHQASGGSDVTGEAGVLFKQGGSGDVLRNAGAIISGREGNYSANSVADSYLAFETALNGTNTEAMRIDSSGRLLVGTQTALGGFSGTAQRACFSATGDTMTVAVGTGTGAYTGIHIDRTSSDGKAISFERGDTDVGSISITTTATAYNTSSDYRLKENVVELTGALDRVDQLKPSRFNFIADADTTVDGFLAHEVADIVPEAITGEKDATEEYEVTPAVLDDEGNVVEEAVMGTRPVYQGIDQSKLVPLLVGAIQELRAEIEQLKNQ